MPDNKRFTCTRVHRYYLYIRNFMVTSYQQDERTLIKTIKDNVSMRNKLDKLRLVIYYEFLKTNNMVTEYNLESKVRVN